MFKWAKGYIGDSEVQCCGQDTTPYLKEKKKNEFELLRNW